MTTEFKFFAHSLPNEKSYINFEFTERQEHSLSCRLIDYNIRATMPLQFLTRKKKIKSINKMAPLNKPMIGWVEEVTSTDIIVSVAYLEPDSDHYKKFQEDSSNNKFLHNVFKRYSKKFNNDLVELWEKYIHPLDLERVQEGNQNLYDYFLTKYKEENWGDLTTFIIDQIETKKSNELLKTKFKLVSIEGIDKVKELFNDLLNDFNLDIYLDNCPNYELVSKDSNIKKEDHDNFMKLLNQKVTDNNLAIYVS